MSIKNIYVTTDNQFELYVENGIVCISLIIEDDKTDETSKSCELIFDRPTIRKLAEQILEVCKTDVFGEKLKI